MPIITNFNCINFSIIKNNNQIPQGETFKMLENVQNDLEIPSTPKCTFQILSKIKSLILGKKKKKKVILN